jgi:hypothetical protein
MTNFKNKKAYQIELYHRFSKYTGQPFWKNYPPYAKTYFEEYFYKKYIEYLIKKKMILILYIYL